MNAPAPKPDALTQDDVQLLTELADAMAAGGLPSVSVAICDIARRIAASLEAAS